MEATLTERNIQKSKSFLMFKIKIYFLQPFFAGSLGFLIALSTLISSYFIITKFFKIGFVAIGTPEFLISFIIGFVPLFIYTSPEKLEKK